MMMVMMKDEWIRAAMSDDVVVAELLLRLKQSHASPPLLTPFKWGLRLPRSKPSSRCDVVSVRKDREPTRCSPTTPLSWSGGASPSAAADADADAFEDCSRSSSIRLAAARSKISALSETTATNTKRSRRKKTFAELKEEESLLMKERTYLKKELATLRVTFKEQRATNESLKRMKIDFNMSLAKGTGSVTDTDEAKEAIPSGEEKPQKIEGPNQDHAPSIVPAQTLSNDRLLPDFCQVKTKDDNVFVLPDLNMMASEDDSCSFETLYGMS